ncbi:AraC family transcriptional regulator [Ruminococcus flavefaciens]|uniref:HTH araC/xylS-type domain-containing protein n=1 Tax=Ruminococcus flavefaciens 007c TaxID=1341157 RepID=W7UEE7_RUMFL|nr:AraC family transcriptional regulator [Ruminococcus flavefaciens]EWM53531.1 hypothetical protein RF007C_07565 [Ruminococcus flavefaciens 007c]
MRIDSISLDHKRDKNFVLEKNVHSGVWILLVLKARAVFCIDGREVPSPENSFIFISPEQSFSYRCDAENFSEDSIFFYPEENDLEYIHSMEIPLNKIIPAADLSQISDIIRNMCLEYYSVNKNRTEAVELYFKLLLSKLNESVVDMDRFGAVHEGLYLEKLLWLRESIYRWPSRSWTVDEMAADISLSRSRLQHLYTETFGISISKDIINSRLDKATELLKRPEYPINKIAELVGYPNASYFNRQFKNGIGMTPTEFRREYQEKEAI